MKKLIMNSLIVRILFIDEPELEALFRKILKYKNKNIPFNELEKPETKEEVKACNERMSEEFDVFIPFELTKKKGE